MDLILKVVFYLTMRSPLRKKDFVLKEIIDFVKKEKKNTTLKLKYINL